MLGFRTLDRRSGWVCAVLAASFHGLEPKTSARLHHSLMQTAFYDALQHEFLQRLMQPSDFERCSVSRTHSHGQLELHRSMPPQ